MNTIGSEEYLRCKICGNIDNNLFITANEMRVNTGNTFRYLRCGECGCIHYIDTPDDMRKYYNSGYYSYNDNKYNPLKRKMITERNAAYADTTGWGGRILKKIFPIRYDFRIRMDLINKYAMDKSSPIIDVGCGSGYLVDMISDIGFKEVEGCDPFIDKECMTCQGNRLYKKTIFEIDRKYQIITMIHSFEHMNNPFEVLRSGLDKLMDGGTIIIEVPIVGYAWEKYGTDWVQFDTPVHYFIHTEKSMRHLCMATGSVVKEIVYKGTGYQFRGSDLVKEGVWIDKQTIEMTERYKEKERYTHYAELLNEMGKSDTAVFVIKKLE